MSEAPFTPHELSEFRLPIIHPRTLVKHFGDLLKNESGEGLNTELWSAVLLVCRGCALAVKSGKDHAGHILWAQADAGFRESISSILWAEMAKQVQKVEPAIARFDAPDSKIGITLQLPGTAMVCALVVDEDTPHNLAQQLALFQACVGYILADELKRERHHLRALVEHSAAWVELSTQFMDTPFFEAACLRLSEQLQRHLNVQGIAIGSSTGNQKGRLHALTGLAEVDPRGRIAELMHTLFVSAHAEDGQKIFAEVGKANSPVLKEVCKQLQIAEATLMPLGESGTGRRFHLLVLGKTTEKAFMQALSQPLSTLLSSHYKTRPRGLKKWTTHLVGKKAAWEKGLLLFSLLAGILFLAQPVPSRLRVQGQLEPKQRRLISAKGDGLLIESAVRPGDVVKAGDTLARMEDRELRLREAELMATRERRLKRRDALTGSADSDVAESQIAALELEETELQLQLIRFQSEQLHILAPIDGVLLAGDLSRRLGSTLAKGDLLFELAPLQQLIAELKVPSRDMSRVEIDLPVRLRLESYPEKEWPSQISHIHGRSQSTDAENPFIIQVPFPEHGNLGLRPGMQVRAVILGESRPRILQILQPWMDQARILFFR